MTEPKLPLAEYKHNPMLYALTRNFYALLVQGYGEEMLREAIDLAVLRLERSQESK